MKICRLCNNPFKDYQKRSRSRCGSCNTKIRRFRAKAAAVNYLGKNVQNADGMVIKPLFSFIIKARRKSFILGNVANKSWDSIKAEIKKCSLLCANCHIIEHSTKNGDKFFREALNYRGRKLEF